MTKLKNISIGSYLFSFLFLLLMGIGFLCNKNTDLYGAGIAAVFGITFMGCIPFAYIVNKLYCKLDNRNCEKYSKISFKKIFLILMICYTIFFISIFPGMVHYDSQICILQYFGIKNPVSAQVVLLNPTQLITDHHRIAYVYLIGIWKNLSWFVFLLLYLGTVFLGPVSGNQRYMLLFVCAFCLYPYVVASQYPKNESGFSTEQFSP